MRGEEKVAELVALLEKAVQRASEPKLGILFSGGIDSTILAVLAEKISWVMAYSTGLKDSQDLEAVREIEKELPFPVKVKEFNPEEVAEVLPVVLKLLGKKDPLQVSCAVPVYLLAREAKKDNIRVMLSGQGSDELFGGYNRYLRHLPNYEKLKEEMESNVKSAYEDNLKRDVAMCSSQGIELRFPFLDQELKDFSLALDPQMKIKEVKGKEFSCLDEIKGKKFVRKHILRKVGKRIGIPEIVLQRPKKALQYGSGSWKVLRKLARENGFREGNYLEKYLESLDLQ